MTDDGHRRLVDAICIVMAHDAYAERNKNNLMAGRDPSAPSDYLDLAQAAELARRMIIDRGYDVWSQLNPMSFDQRGQREAFFAPLAIGKLSGETN